MALLKKFASETVIYGIGSILPRVLTFLLTPYFTRRLGQGEFGNHGVMYAFAALLIVFFTYGMETALFRFGSKEGQLSKVFSTAAISLLGTTILLGTGLYIFSDAIAAFLNEPNRGNFVRWFILIASFDALAALPFAKLRLENRPVRFASLKILNVAILLAITFFMIEACPFLIENGYTWFENIYSIEKRLDYTFLANLIASGCILLIMLREFKDVKLKFDFEIWKTMLTYSLPLIVVGLASVINRQLDRIFLKKLLPFDIDTATEMTGIYNAGVKVAVLMSLFITAFNYAAEPFFFKNADRKDAKEQYAQIAQAFAIVGSLVFLGILFYRDLVQLILGKDFREGMVVVPVLLLAYFFLGLFYNFSIWYKLKDKTNIGAWISVVGASITVVLNFILIPKLGIVGPAWAALSCYVFMALVSFIIGKKYYPIDYPIGRILIYIFTAVGLYFVSEMIRLNLNEDIVSILLVNTALLGVYLVGLFFMEKNNFLKMARK